MSDPCQFYAELRFDDGKSRVTLSASMSTARPHLLATSTPATMSRSIFRSLHRRVFAASLRFMISCCVFGILSPPFSKPVLATTGAGIAADSVPAHLAGSVCETDSPHAFALPGFGRCLFPAAGQWLALLQKHLMTAAHQRASLASFHRR